MERYGKAAALLGAALVVSIAFGWALGAGMGHGQQARAGGGGAGNVIAFAAGEGQTKLYIIDTEAKVILVYDRAGKFAATLIGARTYEYDIEAARKRELPVRGNGYSIIQTKAISEGGTGRRGRR